MTGSTAVATGHRFHHEALLYEDEPTLLGRCVPLLRDALDRGEPTMVMASAPVRDPLLAALGNDAGRLGAVVEAERFWAGGAQTILAWAAVLRDLDPGGPALQVVAEPFWLALPDSAGWHRMEAAANRAFAEVPCRCVCVHDARRLPTGVLATVRRTHPQLTDGTSGRRPVPGPSPTYQDPEELVPTMEPSWTTPPDDAVQVEVASAHDARAFADAQACGFGLRRRAAAMILAVSELAANALRLRPTVTLVAWRSGDTVVVDVVDDAGGGIDPLAGYLPPDPASEGGRGLWLVRSLADDAAVCSGDQGSTVRILFERGPGRP